MSHTRFEVEQRRLAGLTRANRFEELLEFPCSHEFKIIGQTEGLTARVLALFVEHGHPGAVPRERKSSQGRYLALSVEVQVTSGAELDALYTALEKLEGIRSLF